MTHINVSFDDARKFLGMSKETLRKLVNDGKIPATNTGKKERKYYRFAMKDLRAYKGEHPPRPYRRRNVESNGHVPEDHVIVKSSKVERPVGMLSEILAEVKALREEVAELRRIWS